jgi:hypothetical protein
VDLFFDDKNPTFKRIKPQLESELTQVVLAVVCMIDGAIKSTQSKGYRLITYGYHMADLQLLCEMLGRVFNLMCSLKGTSEVNPYTYEVYISGHSYETLRSLVFLYFIPSLYFKFPTVRSTTKKPNKQRPDNVPTAQYNRMPIQVSNLDGNFNQIFASKLAVRKALHIGNATLERALLTGESIRGYTFQYAPNKSE